MDKRHLWKQNILQKYNNSRKFKYAEFLLARSNIYKEF